MFIYLILMNLVMSILLLKAYKKLKEYSKDMRREGIVKWFDQDKGYGRIMLDGLSILVQSHLITKEFRKDLCSAK